MSEKNGHPPKETQDTLWYPPLNQAVDPAAIWHREETAIKEIGVYIHIPFCLSVCKYCPFNKYPWQAAYEEQYLNALKQEMRMTAEMPHVRNAAVIAVYFGGGTPTILKTAQLLELLELCEREFNLSPRAEVCVEANPETVNKEKLKALLDQGVNRISFGVQSFQDNFLKAIGRSHKAHHSVTAIETARRLGLENIGIDLLYRIPGQTAADWEKELRQALALGVHHISTLSLHICPGTALFEEQAAMKNRPDEDADTAMYKKARISWKTRDTICIRCMTL